MSRFKKSLCGRLSCRPDSTHEFAPFNADGGAGAILPLAAAAVYSGYNPYMGPAAAAAMAAAAARYTSHYEPLVNHSYAAPAAAAAFRGQQQQADESDTASRTSGQSSRSKGETDLQVATVSLTFHLAVRVKIIKICSPPSWTAAYF